MKIRRMALGPAAALVPLPVFSACLHPDLAVTLANRL